MLVEPAQSDTRSDKKNLSDKQFAGLERLKCIIRSSFMYRDYVGLGRFHYTYFNNQSVVQKYRK